VATAIQAMAAILGDDDSLGQEAAEKVVEDLKFDLHRASNETPPAPEQTVGGLILHPLTRRGPRAAQTDANIEVSEVLPRWGELKRYSARLNRSSYDRVVVAAKWIYAHMQAHSGGPQACRLRCVTQEMPAGAKYDSLMGNKHLQFENIRTAAMANDFTLVQVGYYRNETLAADRIVANHDRQKFIE
jgi:hypothetical protein